MTKDTGGQAFPAILEDTGIGSNLYSSGGMTLRDYFAGQALSSITKGVIEHNDSEEVASKIAYNFADAMLTERSKE